MSKEIYAEKISKAVNPTEDKPQLSDRTINEMLDTLIPLKGEDEADDAFVERILPIFKTAAGNVRNDVSQFSNAEKKRLEEEYKKNEGGEGGENKNKKVEDKNENEAPEWAKALIESNREMKEWREKQESALTIEKLREKSVNDAREIYPEQVVKAALLNFDFSKEDAEKKFQSSLAEVAGLMGEKPKRGASEEKIDFSEFMKEEATRRGLTE